VLKLTNNTL